MKLKPEEIQQRITNKVQSEPFKKVSKIDKIIMTLKKKSIWCRNHYKSYRR